MNSQGKKIRSSCAESAFQISKTKFHLRAKSKNQPGRLFIMHTMAVLQSQIWKKWMYLALFKISILQNFGFFFFQCQVRAEPRRLKSLPKLYSTRFLIISRSVENKLKYWSLSEGAKKRTVLPVSGPWRFCLLCLGKRVSCHFFSEGPILPWLAFSVIQNSMRTLMNTPECQSWTSDVETQKQRGEGTWPRPPSGSQRNPDKNWFLEREKGCQRVVEEGDYTWNPLSIRMGMGTSWTTPHRGRVQKRGGSGEARPVTWADDLPVPGIVLGALQTSSRLIFKKFYGVNRFFFSPGKRNGDLEKLNKLPRSCSY